MKKYLSIILILAFIGMAGSFTSCKKQEILTETYFVGSWNLVKTEHLYMYDSGDKLVSHAITRDLVYDFAKDSITILCDGQFIYKTSWSFKNSILEMPVLHDDIVSFHHNAVWRIDEVSTNAFTTSSSGHVQTFDSLGNEIDYNDKYIYSLERRK